MNRYLLRRITHLLRLITNVLFYFSTLLERTVIVCMRRFSNLLQCIFFLLFFLMLLLSTCFLGALGHLSGLNLNNNPLEFPPKKIIQSGTKVSDGCYCFYNRNWFINKISENSLLDGVLWNEIFHTKMQQHQERLLQHWLSERFIYQRSCWK